MIGSNNLFGLNLEKSKFSKKNCRLLMFIINRCFKNIWLESQMIHVALFSFQRTTLSFEVCFRLKGFASSDSFIVPHLFQTVKNFFIFLFCLSHPLQQGASNQGAFSCQAGVSRRLVLYYRTRRHLSTAFSKKLAKKVPHRQSEHCYAQTMRDSGIHFSLSVSVIQL